MIRILIYKPFSSVNEIGMEIYFQVFPFVCPFVCLSVSCIARKLWHIFSRKIWHILIWLNHFGHRANGKDKVKLSAIIRVPKVTGQRWRKFVVASTICKYMDYICLEYRKKTEILFRLSIGSYFPILTLSVNFSIICNLRMSSYNNLAY